MNRILRRYKEVAPPGAVEELELLARQVAGRRLQHIYSTDLGGGVTEMLHGLDPLYTALGVDARWDLILGTEEFFEITRILRRGLRGRPGEFTPAMAAAYLECIEDNARRLYISADAVVAHDVQAAAMVRHRDPQTLWLWRCHSEARRSRPAFWRFVKKFVSLYDGVLVSHPRMTRRLQVPTFILAPSVDPFAESQKDLRQREVSSLIRSLGVPMNRPIVLHVGRGEEAKDVKGLLEAVALAQRRVRCTAVLVSVGGEAGSFSAPAMHSPQRGIHVLSLPSRSVLEINALRHAAGVYAQGPGVEGFDLDVLSALWRRKPAIVNPASATAMGIGARTGAFVADSSERIARGIALLLGNPARARRAGAEAREHVRRHFLVTRHVRDYLRLLLSLRKVRA